MKINSEQEMIEFGRKIADKIKKPAVIELVGDVGVGKTTMVKGLAEGLGVKEAITSPSFTISKSYALEDGGNMVHYDFYRLTEPGLMAEDLEESMQGADNVVVIEWGESVADLLPEERITVKVNYCDDGTREIAVDDRCVANVQNDKGKLNG